jgi:hypothetical protein
MHRQVRIVNQPWFYIFPGGVKSMDLVCMLKYILAFLWTLVGCILGIFVYFLAFIFECINIITNMLSALNRSLWENLSGGEFVPIWVSFFAPGTMVKKAEEFIPDWLRPVWQWANRNCN